MSKESWVISTMRKLPKNTKPRKRYNRKSTKQAIQSAHTMAKETNKPYYVFATQQGITVWHEPPPVGQSHFKITPEGIVETRIPEFAAKETERIIKDANKQGRREILQNRIKRGESVGGIEILEEYKGEQWADKVIRKLYKGPFWKPEFDKPRTVDEIKQLITDWQKIVIKFPTESNKAALRAWESKLVKE